MTFVSIDVDNAEREGVIGSYESAKFVGRFYSPVSGEIIEINERVIENPRLINQDPYGSWIVKISTKSLPEDLASPMLIQNGDLLRTWLEEEFARIERE